LDIITNSAITTITIIFSMTKINCFLKIKRDKNHLDYKIVSVWLFCFSTNISEFESKTTYSSTFGSPPWRPYQELQIDWYTNPNIRPVCLPSAGAGDFDQWMSTATGPNADVGNQALTTCGAFSQRIGPKIIFS